MKIRWVDVWERDENQFIFSRVSAQVKPFIVAELHLVGFGRLALSLEKRIFSTGRENN